MSTNPPRDDFFTQIHKAIRHGLLGFALQLGQTDPEPPADRAELLVEWERLRGLLHSHTDHEDRFIFALLETKRPGATVALHRDHDQLEAQLDELDRAVRGAVESPDLLHDAYGVTTAFVSSFLPHLLQEEDEVMPALLTLCTDDELATCRQAFMAEIGPDELAYTLRLMLAGLNTNERATLLRQARVHLPPEVFGVALESAADVLSPARYGRLADELADA